MNLAVDLGPLRLRNPVVAASGTFGYARELAGTVDFSQLGGVIPKTVTAQPRQGNPPPRTVETSAGLLNSIGLDNDGIDHFIAHHLPYLRTLPTAIIANIAGKNPDEFIAMAAKLAAEPGLAALELNLSCPNVAGGVDFATDPAVTRAVVAGVRATFAGPLIAKLTPNVTQIVPIAAAALEGGADAVAIANTFVGMAIDWRKRRPILGNNTGGLSGPAIKPLVLRLVWQVWQALRPPIMGVGGIQSADDAMEYFLAGASAIQVGTANFCDPLAAPRLAARLPEMLAELGASRIGDVVGTLRPNG